MVDAKTVLKVQLFGPPSTEWVDRPLSISRRQVRALLYRLAADQKPVPRERLCFLFWPDRPESAARRMLTGLLSHLQRTLPAPGVLLTEDDQVWLDPDHTWSDTAAFEQLSAQPGHLKQAVDLYRGPFLDGFSLSQSPEFEIWAALERQTWERRYLEALAALIEDHAANEEYGAAIACARDYLVADELAEDIHRRLIELYAATGDRGSALHQFEHLVAVLDRELGVGPLPETEAVYRAILETRPLPEAVLAASPGWTTLPSLDVGLVGRQAALGQLEAAFDRAAAGRGGAVLISGEPGIGKSRLTQDFASRLQDDALLLVGTAYRDTQTTPYQPIVEALRPALRADHAWFDAPPCCLAETSLLLPELRTLYSTRPPSTAEGAQARTRLFEALSNLTLALAAGPHPVLLCLDDLQWADDTTLDWLAYLGRRALDRRILLVGTYRTESAEVVAELRRNLSRLGNLAELELQGLDEAAILQAIRNLHKGRSVRGDSLAAARLQEATGGNPFFILETLRALLDSEQPMQALSNFNDLPLPDSVIEVVETRVGYLSPRARQVLEAGSVLGRAFTLDLVRRTSGRGEMETMDGLDELVARHLLAEQPGEHQFRHELIRMAVYRSLSHHRRQVLHRRAGHALERTRRGDFAALAWHFERAGDLGLAAQYALQAGREARAIFAHVEARTNFERALSLLKEESAQLQEPQALATNRRMRIEAYSMRGWALRLLGDMDSCARDLEEVSRLAQLLQDRRTLAHLRWREAYNHRWFCRYTQAQQAAEEGLSLSRQEGDRLLEARCWREIGMARRETGNYGEARTALERSLALFTDLDEVGYRIHTLGNLATLHWYLGDYSDSMNLAQQALDICDEADLPLQRRLPLGDLGAAAAAHGDADLARRCLEESLSIAKETADRTQEILCLLHLGWLAVRQKLPAEALQHLQAGLELAERIGSCAERGWLLCGLAEAHRLAGETEESGVLAERALQLAKATGRPYDENLALRIVARLEQA